MPYIGSHVNPVQATVQIQSVANKLFPFARMTQSEINEIENPEPGMVVFNINTERIQVRETSGWYQLPVVSL